MSSRKKTTKKNNYNTALVVGSLLGFCLGYYLLNEVATWENPPLGPTFHIVFGCAFMAVSAITILVILRRKYFPKKKKNKSKPIFLDDQKKDNN